MTPLEKAATAMRDAAIAYCDERRGKPDVDIPDDFLAAAAITAFLEAAAEDAGARVALQAAFYDNHSDTIAASRAAILALKETING